MRHLVFALTLALLCAQCSDSSRLLDAAAELAPLDDVPIDDASPLDALAVDASPEASALDAASLDALVEDATLPSPDVTSIGDGGVTFRAWAPAATAATLVTDFGERAMTPDDAGAFAVFAPEAHAGTRYHFTLRNGDRSLTRLDARARMLRDGESVVVDPSSYAWRTPRFTPPALRSAVIYELHIGSYAHAGHAAQAAFH